MEKKVEKKVEMGEKYLNFLSVAEKRWSCFPTIDCSSDPIPRTQARQLTENLTQQRFAVILIYNSRWLWLALQSQWLSSDHVIDIHWTGDRMDVVDIKA